jgi:hypothetical protein
MEPRWSYPIPMAMYPTPLTQPPGEGAAEASQGVGSDAAARGRPDIKTPATDRLFASRESKSALDIAKR